MVEMLPVLMAWKLHMTLWVLREIIVELSRTEFEPNCSQNNLCSFNVSMKNMFQNCQNEYVISNPKGIFDCSAKKKTQQRKFRMFFFIWSRKLTKTTKNKTLQTANNQKEWLCISLKYQIAIRKNNQKKITLHRKQQKISDHNPQKPPKNKTLQTATANNQKKMTLHRKQPKISDCNPQKSPITLLRVIPTMTFIHFVTGTSSGILSDILSGILSGIPSGILSGISSGILPGISSGISSGVLSGILSGISSGILSGKFSGILSGKHSGTLSGIPSGILSGILSGISSGILPGICFGISSGILSGILSGISSGILSGKSSGILSGKHSGTLSGASSGILSDILSGILSGIPSGILSGIYIFWHSIWHIFWHSIWPLRSSGAHWAGQVPGWGPAVHTELGRSQVEVQRCTLSWEGPRLRSSGAHWARKVPGWGPAVHTELGRSQTLHQPKISDCNPQKSPKNKTLQTANSQKNVESYSSEQNL